MEWFFGTNGTLEAVFMTQFVGASGPPVLDVFSLAGSAERHVVSPIWRRRDRVARRRDTRERAKVSDEMRLIVVPARCRDVGPAERCRGSDVVEHRLEA